MTPPPRLIDRVLMRLGYGNPAVTSPKPPTVKPPGPNLNLGMKAPAPNTESPIKSFGTGKEPMSIYGALPITSERILEVKKEILDEEHARQTQASSIASFQGQGSPPGGVGLTDPAIKNAVAQWEHEQKKLFASVAAVPSITATSPVKTYQN